MFYIFFIKKLQKDKTPFLITQIIHNYVQCYGQKDIVISFPGYMSIKKKTIDIFCNNISLPQNTFFTVGMNGTNKVRNNVYNTIQKEYNYHFKSSLQNFSVLKDHSKMLFFLDSTNPSKENNKIEISNCKVKAMLIGSSNQSCQTYFSPTGLADKGESDVFIIDEKYLGKGDNDCKIKEFYEKLIQENGKVLFNRIILSKELFIGLETKDFLNNIFKQTIKLI